MNARWMVSLAAGTALLFYGALLATAAAPSTGQNQSPIQGSAGVVRISTLMGSTVLDLQGQKLGQIKDVLFDSQAGQTAFVVLDATIPVEGHAMLVVPYQALRVSINPSNHAPSVVLDLRPGHLHAAPQIQNDQWQVLENPQLLEQARTFYQTSTYTAARPIENPPSLPPADHGNMASEPVVPPPCVTSDARSDLPQYLIGFFSE